MVIHSGVTQKAICVHRAGLASNWDISPAKVSVGARLGEAVQEGLPCGGLPRAAGTLSTCTHTGPAAALGDRTDRPGWVGEHTGALGLMGQFPQEQR